MQLELQDFTTLVRNMAAGVQGSARVLVDLTTGSVLRAILEANASLALWLQWLIVQVLAATRAATSNGADLDTWVADFGLARLPGQAAATTLVFSRITPGFPATIPVGAQVKTGDNTVTFTVLADPANPDFSATTNSYAVVPSVTAIAISAAATTSGVIGNVQAGAISLLASAMPGIDAVTNPAAAAGGLDAEPDAALRVRFGNFIDSRSRATPRAIAFAIQSLQQGIGFVLAENTDPSGATRPGFFTVTIDDGSGSPPSTLIALVAAAIDAVRPVGTQFAIQPPQPIAANVSITITTPTVNHAAAQLAVSNAITNYISTLPIGVPLRTSRLAALAYAADPSISNVSLLTINGGNDLVPSATGVVKPGTIAVN
ncbi:baseplate J/gp47 family protein [Acidisphaera sp. L21]|uniref:baseplate J/gp47 family protein n=1 Tax=Acidisphaera sp. L21 TaxID=1641851 RepID=UPI00131CE5CF|nr:baseplate J/gp47 family protein [Acidisphaera sp. L21]